MKQHLILLCSLCLSLTTNANPSDQDKLEALKPLLKPKTGEYKHLVNEGGRCVDIAPDKARQNGTRVQIWTCNDNDFQRWKYEFGRLKNASGKCLDVNGPELGQDGARIQIWDCNSAQNQQWIFEQGRLRNASGKCLDIPGHAQWNRDGALLQLWDCNDAPNQQWRYWLR